MQYDIVFFSLFRTDNPYSSISLSMARELAKTNRVFYVNHPYSWKDLLTSGRGQWRRLLFGRNPYETLPSIPQNFVALTPPPTLPINWLPKGLVYRFLQTLNNGIVRRAIGRMLRRYEAKQFIFINCYDPFFLGWLPKRMGAVLSIYHCIDDITQDPYTARHGADLEHEAMRNADVTLVTSTNLQKLAMPHAKRVVPFFNAADVGVFSKVLTETYPIPAELNGRSGPVIGFIGNLDALRIDYVLLKKVAQAWPDATLLLVGPVNSPEPAALGLDRLPNVVFAGSRSLEELPPLLQHMDCTLIPFRCNTLTESIYPLKINEYLAAGKPVVSTRFSADILGFADCIYLAGSHEEFVQRVGEAIQENDPSLVARRVAVAQTNTWTARIAQLWGIISHELAQPNTDSNGT